ncbi:hypothetical protein [Yinghuangia soli]|uniref:Uncharacterized protein n=1 Tax=Yinghuangia soli TaxID=2908204 RepID=A0AA41U2Q6_9ACTN|nr:hypothetical protein [Yinghuangia soli]MCF2532018.1 hypothetical protein [Yinghuangia soli]
MSEAIRRGPKSANGVSGPNGLNGDSGEAGRGAEAGRVPAPVTSVFGALTDAMRPRRTPEPVPAADPAQASSLDAAEAPAAAEGLGAAAPFDPAGRIFRAATLAAAWILALLGMFLLWQGLPGGKGGSPLWAVLGLFASLLGAGAAVTLCLPVVHQSAPDRSGRLWAAAGLITAFTGTLGAVLVLVADQVARVWTGLGLD